MTLAPLLRRLVGARPRRAPNAGSLLRWCALGVLSALVLAAAVQPRSAFARPAGVSADPAAATRAAGVNRLKVGTLVEFDPRKGTVGDAIRFVLEPVHYRLTTRTVDPIDTAAVMRRPVPAIAASAGVMSIESALLLLIGEDHRLVVDHPNRLVAIERMPADANAPKP